MMIHCTLIVVTSDQIAKTIDNEDIINVVFVEMTTSLKVFGFFGDTQDTLS